MAELKTKPTDANVQAFLASITDEQKRKDAEAICKLMQEVTGEPPKMWGSGIVGFGTYHYKYKSGREGDWMVTAFSPRKASLTLYIMDLHGNYEADLTRLGKHMASKGCLYIKRLDDIDLDVLRGILKTSVKNVKSGDFLL